MKQRWQNLVVVAGSVALMQGAVGCGGYGSSDNGGSPTAQITGNKTVLTVGEAIELSSTGSTADTFSWSSNGTAIAACDGQQLCVVTMDTAGTFELGLAATIEKQTAVASLSVEVKEASSSLKSSTSSSTSSNSAGGSGASAGPFAPSDISGLNLWMDAQDSATLFSDTNCTNGTSSGTVACWKDKSGNARNLSGGTGPTLTANAFNSKTALRFNGSSQFLSRTTNTALAAGDDTYTIVAVWQSTTNTSTQVVWEQSRVGITQGSRAALLLVSSTNYGFNGASNDAHNLVPYSASSPRTSIMVVNNGAVTVYDRGVAFSGTINATTGNVDTSFMAVGKNGDSNEYLSGDLGEVMVYDHPLTTTEQQNLEAYLEAKWTITPPVALASLSGLKLWLDADDSTTLFTNTGCTTAAANGNGVACWKDKSGNGYDVTQGTANQRPTLQTSSTINSKPSLNFDPTGAGAGQLLFRTTSTPLAAGDNTYTMIGVWRSTSTGSQVLFEQNKATSNTTTGERASILLNSGSYGFNGYNENLHNMSSYSTSTTYGSVITRNGGAFKLFSNSGSVFTSSIAATTTLSAGVLTVGGRQGSTGYGELLTGNIAEVMIYDRVLTDYEIGQVRAYLGPKWGVTLF